MQKYNVDFRVKSGNQKVKLIPNTNCNTTVWQTKNTQPGKIKFKY